MRLVIQRVSHAAVSIDGQVKSEIGIGLLLLLGIEAADDVSDVEHLCRKVAAMRIFSDENGLMNLSVQDVSGSILVISQFTLHASTKKGNRPSFIRAARPEQAIPLYERFVAMLSEVAQVPVLTGVFGADMKVSLLNDGPVTILMDTREGQGV
jgi:D-aminoacyl-tRNA deacylase